MTRSCLFHISANHYPPLPTGHHTRRIWDELAKGFDEYHVIARGRDWGWRHYTEGNLHLHLLPSCGRRMWPFLFLSGLLPWLIIRYRPTHLLAQCPVLGGLAAAICAVVWRVPLFVELHGAHYFAPARPGWKGRLEHRIYRALSPLAFRAASRIRCLSESMREALRRVYGDRAFAKTVEIPNRVDLAVFRFVKEDYRLAGPLRVVTVGHFAANKNHRALIEDLCRTGMDFHLTLVGAGSLSMEYLALADRLRVSDRIEILSLDHPALAKLLPEQDVYVHFALSEGVPRAVLEAMAAGLPVVASRVGFIEGAVRDGENALLIDKPYADGLAISLQRLSSSEELRRRLGKAARKTIEEHFEWHQVFAQYRSALLEMT